MANTQAKAGYSAKDITVLEGLEPVRLRPGMYIGSTGIRGLHHLVEEIVVNSVDEALAGYNDSIEITTGRAWTLRTSSVPVGSSTLTPGEAPRPSDGNHASRTRSSASYVATPAPYAAGGPQSVSVWSRLRS